MSTKNILIGTAKRVVAEVVGDGKLAEEGARQASDGGASPAGVSGAERLPAEIASAPLPNIQSGPERLLMNENQFTSLLGLAAVKVWPDLPRDAQEMLFAAAVDDGVIANDLAEFLHDRHPRTAHRSKPTRLA